jgi:hypothetical protein
MPQAQPLGLFLPFRYDARICNREIDTMMFGAVLLFLWLILRLRYTSNPCPFPCQLQTNMPGLTGHSHAK